MFELKKIPVRISLHILRMASAAFTLKGGRDAAGSARSRAVLASPGGPAAEADAAVTRRVDEGE